MRQTEPEDSPSNRILAAPLPAAAEIPFAKFNNRNAGGSCYVIGRGPTRFDYSLLNSITEPVFFINDAICLEEHVRSETYFFAHDARMRIWLNGSIRATAVLPIDGKMFLDPSGQPMNHRGNVVYYHWHERRKHGILEATRDELAKTAALFLHSGTIHPLIHFIWYCGFSRVNLIGCDGINSPELAEKLHAPDGYDPRLQNRSLTCPAWRYAHIRHVQDQLITLFGLEARYIESPELD